MKWILTFLAGALVGAFGLFFFLSKASQETAPRPPAVAAVPAIVLTPPASVTVPMPAATVPAAVVAPAPPIEASAPVQPDAAPPPVTAADKLLIPVEGIQAGQLSDTYNQPRGTERKHEALDILAPKGTKVIAVADGKVVKLFNSKPGGLTVYQFDAGEEFAYYYAHLDRYAAGVTEGTLLKRGDLVGYVGTTGNADPAAPHLHFAVFALGPEKQWWKGTPLNPYPLLH